MGLIILLSILGLILIVAEVILIPGIFVTGLIGLGCTIGACYLAFDAFGATSGWIVSMANIATCIVVLLLTLRSKTWKKMTLSTTLTDTAATNGAAEEALFIGQSGQTLSRINPMGKAQFGDDTFEVIAQDGWIDAQTIVEIIRIEDHKIYVKPSKTN